MVKKMRLKYTCKTIFGLASCVLASLIIINEANADGTDQLGPPSISINSGSYVLVEGAGLLETQPNDITMEIPMDVSIAQVLLYWTGRDGADDTLEVNGTNVTGSLIGGTANEAAANTYRADITDLSSAEGWLVVGQTNVLSVGGLDFTRHNNGAAVVAIIDDGSMVDIKIMDGTDDAYLPWNVQTAPVDIPVAPSADPRVGTMHLIVSDIEVPRPAAVEITVGGVPTLLTDVFLDNEGDNLDVVELEIPVPAGATNVIVQALSIDDGSGLQPASLYWHFVSWVITPPPGGGGHTPGFWQNKNGQALIEEGDIDMLNLLCLSDDNGHIDNFADKGEFKRWLKKRRATNMAYQLSGHLAAMMLNVSVGFVDGDALVYLNDEGDMISIYDLMDAAATALCEDGYTPSGDENRGYQGMLKDALDDANNNLNWVNP